MKKFIIYTLTSLLLFVTSVVSAETPRDIREYWMDVNVKYSNILSDGTTITHIGPPDLSLHTHKFYEVCGDRSIYYVVSNGVQAQTMVNREMKDLLIVVNVDCNDPDGKLFLKELLTVSDFERSIRSAETGEDVVDNP